MWLSNPRAEVCSRDFASLPVDVEVRLAAPCGAGDVIAEPRRVSGWRELSRSAPGARAQQPSVAEPSNKGQVAEWLMAADCKSAAPCELRRFESSPVHQVCV